VNADWTYDAGTCEQLATDIISSGISLYPDGTCAYHGTAPLSGASCDGWIDVDVSISAAFGIFANITVYSDEDRLTEISSATYRLAGPGPIPPDNQYACDEQQTLNYVSHTGSIDWTDGVTANFDGS